MCPRYILEWSRFIETTLYEITLMNTDDKDSESYNLITIRIGQQNILFKTSVWM